VRRRARFATPIEHARKATTSIATAWPTRSHGKYRRRSQTNKTAAASVLRLSVTVVLWPIICITRLSGTYQVA